MQIHTEKLRNGLFALARPTKYGLSAYSYSNFKQAEIRQMLLLASGIESNIRQFNGGPFYVIVVNPTQCPNQ